MSLPVETAYDCPFPASDVASWEAEYEQNIRVAEGLAPLPRDPGRLSWGLTEPVQEDGLPVSGFWSEADLDEDELAWEQDWEELL